jgi:hypothetical protein
MTDVGHPDLDREDVRRSATPSQRFRYRAFLSYSHRDKAAAEWLHKALESYRVPQPLVGTPGRDGPIPQRLFPVFRDRDELNTAASLSASIQEALAQSANLIVLCSPAAVQSQWVNQEILLFKKLGRADRIHALIVDGEASAGSGEACFPPALVAKVGLDGQPVDGEPEEPLAADITPDGDGRDDAKLKLIAGMLGVPFDALRRREAAAARRRLRVTQTIAGIMIALVLTAGAAGWLTWYFRRAADELRIPGIRVASRETVVDLSGWQETTAAEIANLVKKSLAVATDHYTLVKTQEYAQNYVHIIGSSSEIPPEVSCRGCVIERRTLDGASRTRHEYKLVFDLSNVKLEGQAEIEYTTKYWNAFQTPDQWWTGTRVLYQTEAAIFAVIFPAGKHPMPDKIRYSYFDIKDHPYQGDLKVALDKDEAGRVAKLTWQIPYPSTDRSYRVSWDWNEVP